MARGGENQIEVTVAAEGDIRCQLNGVQTRY